MKICWDSLEGVYLDKKTGDFKKGVSFTLVYIESCLVCGEPYLSNKYRISMFCSKNCAHSGEYNGMFGRKRSQHTKDAISDANTRGGFTKSGLASFTTHDPQISWAEKTRRRYLDNVKYLEVVCAYCGKWFIPKSFEVRARKNSLLGKRKGMSLFYCSEGCKVSCPTFHKQKYHDGFKRGSSREVDSFVRKLCFERDNWECQKCGTNKNLHCHHIKSYALNKMLANDIDNCLTLCMLCHKEVHKQEDCKYNDLKCGD